MPKLNVKQNNSNVIKAFQVALETGHRNLLDNPWWGSGEVVNQRQITAKPSNGSYGIDRWVFTSGADANTISLGASGITFTISSSYIWQVQRFSNVAAWSGKTLTASVLFSNGTVKSGSKPFTLGTAVNFFEDSTVALTMNTSGYFSVTIKATSTIRAVKLELGSYSTLANDVPPDYGEELAKCQRYFVRIHFTSATDPFMFGIGYNTTTLRCRMQTPVQMRSSNPRIVKSNVGTLYLAGNGAATQPVTDVAVVVNSGMANGVILNVTTSGSIAVRTVYAVGCSSTGYIDLSADL